MKNTSNNITMSVTTLDDLKAYNSGTLVELPEFAEGQPFVAKLKRPSLLAMIKGGKIPNQLLDTANSLFSGEDKQNSKSKKTSEARLKEMFDVFDLICEAAFVEPSYSDLKNAGIELTDEQYIFIFNYTQNGVKALSSFRQK